MKPPACFLALDCCPEANDKAASDVGHLDFCAGDFLIRVVGVSGTGHLRVSKYTLLFDLLQLYGDLTARNMGDRAFSG